jgi:hypothetical protein
MSLAPSGVVTVNARSHGQATVGSCFATLHRKKKQVYNASLGRRLPDTVDLSEGLVVDDTYHTLKPIVGLIASSVGPNEGRHGLRPSVALHIGGAKTCPRQLVSKPVFPGRPVMMNVAERTKRKRDDKKLYASITGSREKDLKVDRQIIFASCISGGAGDNSIDVVLGGSYNAYVRGHDEYHKDNFK